MQLQIITPEKIIYDGAIDKIVVNTADGEIGILPNHVNLFTKVLPGEVTLKSGSKNQFMAITGGFLQVARDEKNQETVTILADYAVRAEEIEINKALAAQKRAEDILKKKESGIAAQDLAAAQGDLRRAILELKVAKRRHRSSNIPPQN